MAKTNKQNIRAVRQEELRAKLAAQGHLQHVIQNVKKIQGLNVRSKTFKNSLDKLNAATSIQLRLINKYLPDLKSTELTGKGGGKLIVNVVNYGGEHNG